MTATSAEHSHQGIAQRIIVEKSKVSGIPILTMARDGVKNAPTVIFVHGFTADKTEGLPLGYRLAELGFLFISLDAYMHGERLDERLEHVWEPRDDQVFPHESGLDTYFLMHEIILQTAQDIDVLIGRLRQDSRADLQRVGITGLSMGGFITFYVAANNPRVQVAVPMISVPAFAARWEDVVLEASSYQKWAQAMAAVQDETARRTAFMRKIDPFGQLQGFSPKPLLMINGDKDTDSPKKYSVDLYRTLQPWYAAHPERLRFSIHDDAGHEVTSAMMQEACDWFSRYLQA